MEKILVVEDEPDIAELINFNLSRRGYEVVCAHDGITGLKMTATEKPDLVILDLMLPGKDGFSVFKEMKRNSTTSDIPVLILTARAQTEDRITGLEAGADDYLTKPFSPKELALRVQAILRRRETRPGAVVFNYGDFTFDKNNLKFHIKDERIDLTSTEFKLLLFLCERAGKTQDRNDILRSVFEYSDDSHSRTLDTHMKRLRRKMGDYSSMVETIRGIGYRIAELS